MNNSRNLLIKATVYTLATSVATVLSSNAALAQESTQHSISKQWQSLTLGSCKIQTSHSEQLNQRQQHAFLYCKGAPNSLATAVVNLQGLKKSQVKQMQCHSSLSARQINCFVPQAKLPILVQHIAQIDLLNQCRAISWLQDENDSYYLAGKNCVLNANTYSELTSYISLSQFKAQTEALYNPVIVNYNGELLINSDTSMGDDPDVDPDDTGKTSMGDDPDVDPDTDPDSTGKTSMGDDLDYTIETSMGDDPDIDPEDPDQN